MTAFPVGNKRSTVLFVIVIVLLFTLQCWPELESYLSFDSTVSIRHNSENIRFPASVSCSSERFNFSQFCEDRPDTCSGNSSLEEPWQNYTQSLEGSLMKLKDHGFKCRNTFLIRIFHKKSFIKTPISEYYDSNYGNCLSFNIDWDNFATVYKPDILSAKFMRLLYNLKPDSYYRETPQFLLRFWPVNTAPTPEDAYVLNRGTSYWFIISQKETVRLPLSEQCTDYEALGRAHFRKGILSKELCLSECHANKTLELCGCMYKEFYPYAYETKKPLCHLVNNQCPELLTKEKILEIQSSCKRMCRKPCRDKVFKTYYMEQPNSLKTDPGVDIFFFDISSSVDITRDSPNYLNVEAQYNFNEQITIEHSLCFTLYDFTLYIGAVISTWVVIAKAFWTFRFGSKKEETKARPGNK
ncbi:degenerin unc-8-like [Tachypleus tridentatus]|uniref:degenerin unc-8-like n=1 Tax=Tachypleus tridentatus TaxID=6853 RepID=UPI003FD474B2